MVLMRVTDLLLAVPSLILAIALAAFLGPSLTNAMFAIGVAAAPVFIRLTRGQMSRLAAEYVDAARTMGFCNLRIILRHILPNILAVLLVQATLSIADAIIAEAGLSFLGLGQHPPKPSWGASLMRRAASSPMPLDVHLAGRLHLFCRVRLQPAWRRPARCARPARCMRKHRDNSAPVHYRPDIVGSFGVVSATH